MLVTAGGDKSFIIFKTIHSHSHSLLLPLRRRNVISRMMSKRKDVAEASTTQQQQQLRLKLKVPINPILARSAVAVFALGFIDAGYSGDWSRIGVISKEVEGLLKIAAILVVPLCILFIFSLSNSNDNEPAD